MGYVPYVEAYATYVAITRLTDYKHRPEDVIAGAAIGIAAALLCRPRGIGARRLRLGDGGQAGGRGEEITLISPGGDGT